MFDVLGLLCFGPLFSSNPKSPPNISTDFHPEDFTLYLQKNHNPLRKVCINRPDMCLAQT